MGRTPHRRLGGLLAAAWLAAAASSHALGPHEIVLLVNGNSPRSVEIANRYAHLRQIPLSNVVFLSLPDSVLEPEADIAPADFTRLVWEPANRAIDERGIRDHVLAWVYSADFPVRVTADPPVSLTGATLVRNSLPPPEDIAQGRYVSPLFRGPDQPDGPSGGTLSLEQFAMALGTNMPLPAMMLGHTGARGLTVEEVMACLRRGNASDSSAPRSPVCFWVTDDVRSTCRSWQFPAAVEELKALGVRAFVSPSAPGSEASLAGALAGIAVFNPRGVGKFVPGAVGGHLTSFGAYFHDPKMTVLTEWIRAGVTASDGTVVEPLSNWRKFPNARLFAHYARGCTVLESYAQAVRSPLQLLVVGEPLARPWAPRSSMVAVRVDDGSDPGQAAFHADLVPAPAAPPDYFFLVDGKTFGGGVNPDLAIPAGTLPDGYHDLQVVAYQRGPVRHQAFVSCGFSLSRKGRAARLEGLPAGSKIDLHRPLKVKVAAEGKPGRLGVACGARIVAAGPDAVVDPQDLGKGPVTLQAVAFYEDGEAVRGEPVPVEVADLNRSPAIEAVSLTTNGQGRLVAAVRVSDPDGGTVTVDWFQGVSAAEPDPSGGRIEQEGDTIRFFTSTSSFDTVFFPEFPLESVSEITAVVSVPESGAPVPMLTQKAGLVFSGKDRRNFRYFGISGESSAWVLGECREGRLSVEAARGAYIQPGKGYRLSVRKAGTGIECLVDGEIVLKSAGARFGKTAAGVMASGQSVNFTRLAVTPPVSPAGAFEAAGDGLAMAQAAASKARLFLRASDGLATAEKALNLTAR